jgi:hypothetical protein
VRKLRREVEIQKSLLELNTSGFHSNFFRDHVGLFWGMLQPRDYCRALAALANKIQSVAWEYDRLSMWNQVIDLSLELLRLTYSDNQGIREIMPLRRGLKFCAAGEPIRTITRSSRRS